MALLRGPADVISSYSLGSKDSLPISISAWKIMNFIKKILSVSFILFKLICLIFDHGLFFSRRFEMSGFNPLELEYIQVDLIKNWSEIVNQLISLF